MLQKYKSVNAAVQRPNAIYCAENQGEPASNKS